MRTLIVFWFLTMVSSVLGGLVLVLGDVLFAQGAPQQAAAAAIGIGLAVIPYCFTRALSEGWRGDGRIKG